MHKTKFIVVTSIQDYSDTIKKYANMNDWHVIYIGDKKTPQLGNYENVTLISLEQQLFLDYKFVKYCPINHYSRKNIGYLHAMQKGASVIADVDDDNFPNEDWGNSLSYQGAIRKIQISSNTMQVVNIYKAFTDKLIWPRGLPLSYAKESANYKVINSYDYNKIVVWQGLVNGDPDVDAIFRLLFGPDLDVSFNIEFPVVLSSGIFSPFNSQNTFWFAEGFPLLYLPISVTFRFTDILRSYVAQVCLWAMNREIGFTNANAHQKRNQHNLLADFNDEIPCYLQVPHLIEILSDLELTGKPGKDLIICYAALSAESIVKEEEMIAVNAWLEDIAQINVGLRK